jgi:hypothetical protein
MSTITHVNETAGLPNVQGHTIGFVDSWSACQAITDRLNEGGIDSDRVVAFQGNEGIAAWDRLLEGSRWGESVDDVLKEGLSELRLGHCVLLVEVGDDKEAALVASISTQHGGHGIHHFGLLIDTRLTP